MRRLCLLGSALAAALLVGCKETADESVFLIDASQAVEADITDVATDFRIIRLKSDEPLDTDMDYFFFDKWILGLPPNERGFGHLRLNLFDREGNLVSVLNRVGRGPGGVVGPRRCRSEDRGTCLERQAAEHESCVPGIGRPHSVILSRAGPEESCLNLAAPSAKAKYY